MMRTLLSYFEGEAVLCADAKYQNSLTELMVRNGIKAKISADDKNGEIIVRLSPKNAKKTATALDKTDIIVYIISMCGFKYGLLSHCKRIGMLVGMLLFFVLLSVSTLFVFKVEISGSELISASEVKEELAEFGIRAGARISEIDRTEAANRFLQLHPELSWASVIVKGTTVRLEIKEKTGTPSLENEKADFLVAGFDGVVKSVLVYSGKPMITVNSVVKKGDLLISGYISGSGLQYTESPMLRYEGASGSVTAEVSDLFSVRALFSERYSTTKKGERCGVVFEILGKKLSFGNVCENGDRALTAERNLTLWDRLELPITVRECYTISETVNEVNFTEEQAADEARQRAYTVLNERLAGASLCEIKTSTVTDGEGITVTVEYICLREIAVPKMSLGRNENTATE